NTLVAIVPSLFRPQSFLLDSFFPNVVTSDSEFVSIDVEAGERRLSPFVSPLVAGKVVEQLSYATNTFKPPYIKDKISPDIRKPVRRMIGERIGGDKDGPERWAANIALELENQIKRLTRRLEWMASQALQTGHVIVSGDGFQTADVDFKRDASLTVTKSGSAKWTVANVLAGTATPVKDIEHMQRTIMKLSGAHINKVLFTNSAWDGFVADPILKGSEYFPSLAPFGNQINIGSEIVPGAIYKGKFGQFELYNYTDFYRDDSGNLQPMLTDGKVILAGPDLMGIRAFGQIMDPKFNFAALPFAPKSYFSEDPAQFFILMQSAPLVVPARVDASACIVACDAVFDV